jgi:hypothetical protein
VAMYLLNKTTVINYICIKRIVAKLFLFILLLLFSVSCFTEADCLITATTAIKIDFKQTKTDKITLLKSVVDSALVFTSVWVSGIDSAYIKFVKDKQYTSVTLPINPQKKSVQYVFNIQSKSGVILRKDSIQLSFSNESRVISQKCGAYTYFLDLKVISTSFDSTKYKLTNNRLLKGVTNVQVFF